MLMFGFTEFVQNLVCYAKFSEEFKSEKKIGGNSARKKVIVHFIVFHTTFEHKSMRQTKITVITIYPIYVE